MNTGPTVVGLFSGAGGLSWGLAESGFRVLGAVDNWDVALRTFNKNHRYVPAVRADLATLDGADLEIMLKLKSGTPDVVVGGPPCQGFSSAGLRRRGDTRNTLVGAFSRLVAHLRPPIFVFENVEGFLTAEGGSRVIELLEPLVSVGYRRRAFRRVKDGTPTEKRGGAPAGLRRLCPDEPAKAVTGDPCTRVSRLSL